MEWFKKHVDTCIVLGAVLSSVFWMNGNFNKVEKDILSMQIAINDRFSSIDKDISIMQISINERFSSIDKDIAILKTVLIMNKIMPHELIAKSDNAEVK